MSKEYKDLFDSAYTNLLSTQSGIEVNPFSLLKIDPSRARVLFESARATFEDPERQILIEAPHLEVNEIAADAAVKRIETQAVKSLDAPVFSLNAPGMKEETLHEVIIQKEPVSFLNIFTLLLFCSTSLIFFLFYFMNWLQILEYALYYSASLIPFLFSISLFLYKNSEKTPQSLK